MQLNLETYISRAELLAASGRHIRTFSFWSVSSRVLEIKREASSMITITSYWCNSRLQRSYLSPWKAVYNCWDPLLGPYESQECITSEILVNSILRQVPWDLEVILISRNQLRTKELPGLPHQFQGIGRSIEPRPWTWNLGCYPFDINPQGIECILLTKFAHLIYVELRRIHIREYEGIWLRRQNLYPVWAWLA